MRLGVLIVVWLVIAHTSHNAGFAFWIILGFMTGPVLAFVLHAKVRSIVQIHCADEIRTSLNKQTRRHSIKVYGATPQQRLHDDYPTNFWFGKETKAAFTLNMIRIIVLCQSVYVAVICVGIDGSSNEAHVWLSSASIRRGGRTSHKPAGDEETHTS